MADMKTLWFKGEDGEWKPVSLHAIDANHALEADPEHWAQSKPESEPEEMPAADVSGADEETEQ